VRGARASAEVLARVSALRLVCARHEIGLRDAALHYALAFNDVSTLVVGMGSPAELDANLESLRRPVLPALWDDLASIGVVAPI
jgi:D-threo-aldose 1-dehydrogenase